MAAYLAEEEWILRSGGADGADKAFEAGCDTINPMRKEIYLPWQGFNGSKSPLYNPMTFKAARESVKIFHPSEGLSQGVVKLMARNYLQVMGQGEPPVPVKFILCFTEGGLTQGGTSQALRIALNYNIPVFNLANLTVKQVWESIHRFTEGGL